MEYFILWVITVVVFVIIERIVHAKKNEIIKLQDSIIKKQNTMLSNKGLIIEKQETIIEMLKLIPKAKNNE